MAVGSSNDFDLVVLGAGTGGYTAAFRAGQLGLKVALVDEDKIGGTCLHRGCIPTKALLSSADLLRRIRRAAEFGIVVDEPKIDFGRMMARKEEIVLKQRGGVEAAEAFMNNLTIPISAPCFIPSPPVSLLPAKGCRFS